MCNECDNTCDSTSQTAFFTVASQLRPVGSSSSRQRRLELCKEFTRQSTQLARRRTIITISTLRHNRNEQLTMLTEEMAAKDVELAQLREQLR